MKVTIVGASGGQVTGSAYLVETAKARILVDCGMFQGGKAAESRNRLPPKVNKRCDAVLITHGHLDHTGRLPLLSKIGYSGPVYATPATREMAALILRDSARLQMADNERTNRRRQRAGEEPCTPLYTVDEAEHIISRFRDVPYRTPVTVAPGIEATWAESGHMLGSASIQLTVQENGSVKRVVFSGDLGPRTAPIMREFEPFDAADVVFMESTYGDRDHRPFRQTVDEFVGVVKDAVKKEGKILVPTFAVGRAQLITLLLSWMFRKNHVKPFPTFLDSPMAIEATKIYTRHTDLFDDDMKRYMQDRPLREDLKLMQQTTTAAQSKKINEMPGPCLIMAGAGMCNAGRILHHLRANVWRPETHVMIVGYQGRGSLGRQLVDGAKLISIFGEKVAVRAQVHTMSGFSAHAGQTDLMSWYEKLAPANPRVVLTHGEDGPRNAFAALLSERYGVKPLIPALGETIEI